MGETLGEKKNGFPSSRLTRESPPVPVPIFMMHEGNHIQMFCRRLPRVVIHSEW